MGEVTCQVVQDNDLPRSSLALFLRERVVVWLLLAEDLH